MSEHAVQPIEDDDEIDEMPQDVNPAVVGLSAENVATIATAETLTTADGSTPPLAALVHSPIRCANWCIARGHWQPICAIWM
jgi:hypothetical protein